jgi:hypothetical protein
MRTAMSGSVIQLIHTVTAFFFDKLHQNVVNMFVILQESDGSQTGQIHLHLVIKYRPSFPSNLRPPSTSHCALSKPAKAVTADEKP